MTKEQQKEALRDALVGQEYASLETIDMTDKSNKYAQIDKNIFGGALPKGMDASQYNIYGEKQGDEILVLSPSKVIKRKQDTITYSITDNEKYDKFITSDDVKNLPSLKLNYEKDKKLVDISLLENYNKQLSNLPENYNTSLDIIKNKVVSGESLTSNEEILLFDINEIADAQNKISIQSPTFFNTRDTFYDVSEDVSNKQQQLLDTGVLTKFTTTGWAEGDSRFNIVTQRDIDTKYITAEALSFGIYDAGEEDRASTRAKVTGEVITLAENVLLGAGVGYLLKGSKSVVTVGGKVVKGAKILPTGKVIDKAGKVLYTAKIVKVPTKVASYTQKVITSKPVRYASEGWTGEIHDIVSAGIGQYTEIKQNIKEKDYVGLAGNIAWGYTKEKIGDKLTGIGLRSQLSSSNGVDSSQILQRFGRSDIKKGDVNIGRIFEFDKTPDFKFADADTWSAKSFSKMTGIDFGRPDIKVEPDLFRFKDSTGQDVDFSQYKKFSSLKNVKPEDYGFDAVTGNIKGQSFKNIPEPDGDWIHSQMTKMYGTKYEFRTDLDSAFVQKFRPDLIKTVPTKIKVQDFKQAPTDIKIGKVDKFEDYKQEDTLRLEGERIDSTRERLDKFFFKINRFSILIINYNLIFLCQFLLP